MLFTCSKRTWIRIFNYVVFLGFLLALLVMTWLAYLDNGQHSHYNQVAIGWGLFSIGIVIYNCTMPDLRVFSDTIILKRLWHVKPVFITDVSDVTTYPFYTVIYIRRGNILLKLVGLLANGRFSEFFAISKTSHTNYDMLIAFIKQKKSSVRRS